MTTEIATIPDGLDPQGFVCEMYLATGGLTLFLHEPDSDTGTKFRLNASNAAEFLDALFMSQAFDGCYEQRAERLGKAAWVKP